MYVFRLKPPCVGWQIHYVKVVSRILRKFQGKTSKWNTFPMLMRLSILCRHNICEPLLIKHNILVCSSCIHLLTIFICKNSLLIKVLNFWIEQKSSYTIKLRNKIFSSLIKPWVKPLHFLINSRILYVIISHGYSTLNNFNISHGKVLLPN